MRSRRLALFALLSLLLFGALAISAPAAAATNTPPVISGTPPTLVEVGQFYSFRPRASDADGDRLSFSIVNKPAWASFSRKSGRLSGTPNLAHAGNWSGVRIYVHDRVSSAALAPFDITVTAATPANSAPVISGLAVTSARAGTPYLFQPVASDADGDSLSFSILNRPAWALFDSASGRLAGTPGSADVGTTSAITIRASDGIAVAQLPPFDLTVVAASDALLTWDAPSMRTSGVALALSEIAGYRIYHGPAAAQLTLLVDHADPTATQYTVQALAAGTHYFAVSVYDTAGAESTLSPAVWISVE